MLAIRASAASALVLGAIIAAVAFGAAGGTELTRTSTVEVLLALAGGLVVAVGVLYGRQGPCYGATAVLLFGALAAIVLVTLFWLWPRRQQPRPAH